MVFSPLGYSTVLAIFAEGARGASREEIATALHFPEDVKIVRESYKRVLEKLAVSVIENSRLRTWKTLKPNNANIRSMSVMQTF